MESPQDKLINTKEASIVLGVCEETVRRYIKQKKLKASKLGQYRIRSSDLAAFIASGNLEQVGSNA
jgi:excisionase family DNA binding protein